MKTRILTISLLFFLLGNVAAQSVSDTPLLNTILRNYYKQEKAIYKGRNQLLFLFCDKANNNEEIYETVNGLKLPAETVRSIKQQVATDTAAETWASSLDEIYTTDKTNLNIKINSCLSLEEYQVKRQRLNLNNQRLMIVSKPVYYDKGTRALVKVVFYRSIEHNNGSVLLMEKVGDEWVIKEYLNTWST
ncbi:MAG TPA: hypothetical protein VGB43_06335 [Flavobacterium sp.]|jgi:hypothetical protein